MSITVCNRGSKGCWVIARSHFMFHESPFYAFHEELSMLTLSDKFSAGILRAEHGSRTLIVRA